MMMRFNVVYFRVFFCENGILSIIIYSFMVIGTAVVLWVIIGIGELVSCRLDRS